MKLFLTFIFGLLLSACQNLGQTQPLSQPIATVVVQKQLALVTPSSSDLLNCEKPKPPEIKAYMAMSADQKEDALTRYGISLNAAIDKCNNQLESIRYYIQTQRVLVERFNKEEAERAKTTAREIIDGK